ncbi:MAG: hypothetical protein QOI78_6061 [Actinomycetota bacterium]|nr:hypothetical protein [Actinomycetota bacterium]MDT7802628.1 hypothetical protein [Actinomycetota bacterium]
MAAFPPSTASVLHFAYASPSRCPGLSSYALFMKRMYAASAPSPVLTPTTLLNADVDGGPALGSATPAR